MEYVIFIQMQINTEKYEPIIFTARMHVRIQADIYIESGVNGKPRRRNVKLKENISSERKIRNQCGW